MVNQDVRDFEAVAFGALISSQLNACPAARAAVALFATAVAVAESVAGLGAAEGGEQARQEGEHRAMAAASLGEVADFSCMRA